MSAARRVPVRLDPAAIANFSDLVAGIAGHPTPAGSLPWLAPALLFSNPAVQARIGMPAPVDAEILVQDYQSVSYAAPLSAGTEFLAEVLRRDSGATHEFDFELTAGGSAVVVLKTALRRVARRNLAALKPTRFPDPAALGSLALETGLRIDQAAVDRYVGLSGDRNPIHSDPAEACTLGLPAPIVPGLLLVSTAQPVLGRALPGARLTSLKCRFMAPLCVGVRFGVALQSRGPGRLRAYVSSADARALAMADLIVET